LFTENNVTKNNLGEMGQSAAREEVAKTRRRSVVFMQ
jgi:hypothetical protein